MAKQLERDLGLPSVFAISIGAMVGSGIFILPGLALKMAGPAVILAYLLAGLLVLPAALSKSEMATAMPEAGGTYIYIERGMGPLLGTIAGVGTWFSLTFKGALALVGGAPYLVLLFDLPVKPVAIGAALILIAINLVGVKQTGRLQIAIVIVMLGALAWLIVGGVGSVDPGRYEGFFASGIGGILTATGFVYVSYAGVTKIASVAEEIENPDRNIPLGILGSLFVTTLLYVALVFLMVGVAPAEELSGSVVPMAIAADVTLARIGIIAVVVAAILALVSTANAGILSSSRYPFAMSRDNLAPASLNVVHNRFSTPTRAITLTGAVLLVFVAFVPIEDIAKLASAFKILVFILVNFAVIAFRKGAQEWYEPSFRTPLYPFPQLIGIIGGGVLLTQMGTIPLLGAGAITAGSLAWYYAYVYRRGGVDREGAAKDVVRRRLGRHAVAETESAVTSQNPYEVLIAVTERTTPETETTLFTLGGALARAKNGSVRVVQFDEVPDQTALEMAAGEPTPADASFEAWVDAHIDEAKVPVDYGEIVSHDTKHAMVNYAKSTGVDAILLERPTDHLYSSIFGSDIGWIKHHAPCHVIEIEDRGIDTVQQIALVSDRGPYDSAKIMVADAIASEYDASIEFLFAMDPMAPEQHRETIRAYLNELAALCSVPVTTRIIETENRVRGLVDALADADLIVVGAESEGLRRMVTGWPTDRIVDSTTSTALLVYEGRPSRIVRMRQAVENRLF